MKHINLWRLVPHRTHRIRKKRTIPCLWYRNPTQPPSHRSAPWGTRVLKDTLINSSPATANRGSWHIMFVFCRFVNTVLQDLRKHIFYHCTYIYIYWIVRKIRADFEGKLKRRRFKFLISFIKFKSFAARTSGRPDIYVYIPISFLFMKFNIEKRQIKKERLPKSQNISKNFYMNYLNIKDLALTVMAISISYW